MSLMKIKDLFHFEKGSLQSTKATPGEYDFITAAANWKTHNEFTHDCEALVFAAAASGSLGRTHYVNGKFISSDLCFIITPKDADKYPIDLKFYHLIFLAFKEEIVRNTKSGTSKEAIGLTVFGKYELPYFDIEKQIETREQFVNTQVSTNKLEIELSYQLDLITLLRQSFLKDAMKGSLMAQAPNDEPSLILLKKIKAEKDRLLKEKKIKKQQPLPPIKKEETPFEIPENWVWCRLGSVVEMSRGRFSIRPRNDPRYFNGPYPFLQIGSLDQNGSIITEAPQTLNEKGLAVSKLFPKDTIVIAIVGGTIGNLGILGKEMCFTDSIIGFFPFPVMYNQKFILNFLRFKQPEIKSSSYQMSGQPNIKIPTLSELYFPMPPLNEQERIVTKLDELMEYCNTLESGIKGSLKQNELFLKQVLTEALGIKIQKEKPQKETTETEQKASKFDPNTTLMEIVELLKKHGKLHAEELWKMSKYPDDIDAFYAELKKQIELNKIVKESAEKGYLELA